NAWNDMFNRKMNKASKKQKNQVIVAPGKAKGGARDSKSTNTGTAEIENARGKNRTRSTGMETSGSLHRPDWTPRNSKSAIGRIRVANRVSESARPARLARRSAMIMPTERLMKTNGCPIQETHRAKTTVGLRSILSRLTCYFQQCARLLHQTRRGKRHPGTSH